MHMQYKTNKIGLLFIYFTIATSPVFSCTKKSDNPIKESNIIFNYDELGAYNQQGNLDISARFSECGEWGGHLENIRIYRESINTIYARYKVYPFRCDSLNQYYSKKVLKPIIDTVIALDYRKQQAVSSYITRLVRAKLVERFPGHAGNTFSAIKSDSTLIIEVYDSSSKNESSYKELISELF